MTTQAQDAASATPPSRRRIIGYNPGLTGFAGFGLLAVFAFSWGLLASPPNDARNLLNAPLGVNAALVLGTVVLNALETAQH